MAGGAPERWLPAPPIKSNTNKLGSAVLLYGRQWWPDGTNYCLVAAHSVETMRPTPHSAGQQFSHTKYCSIDATQKMSDRNLPYIWIQFKEYDSELQLSFCWTSYLVALHTPPSVPPFFFLFCICCLPSMALPALRGLRTRETICMEAGSHCSTLSCEIPLTFKLNPHKDSPGTGLCYKGEAEQLGAGWELLELRFLTISCQTFCIFLFWLFLF